MRGRIVANQCVSAPPHVTDHSLPWPCHAYAAPHMRLFQSIEGIPLPLPTGMPARCLQMKVRFSLRTEGEDYVRADLAGCTKHKHGDKCGHAKVVPCRKK